MVVPGMVSPGGGVWFRFGPLVRHLVERAAGESTTKSGFRRQLADRGQVEQLAHLDGVAAQALELGGDANGLVMGAGPDQVVPAEHLVRLGERAVGDQLLAVTNADARGRLRRV